MVGQWEQFCSILLELTIASSFLLLTAVIQAIKILASLNLIGKIMSLIDNIKY